MEEAMPGWLLTTIFLQTLLSASAAVAYWRLVSASSPSRKWKRDLEQQISDLQSSFDALMDSHKRLRSRQGMADLRAKRRAPEGPESKGELLRRLGLAGKAGPDFAKAQLLLNADDSN